MFMLMIVPTDWTVLWTDILSMHEIPNERKVE